MKAELRTPARVLERRPDLSDTDWIGVILHAAEMESA